MGGLRNEVKGVCEKTAELEQGELAQYSVEVWFDGE